MSALLFFSSVFDAISDDLKDTLFQIQLNMEHSFENELSFGEDPNLTNNVTNV